MRKELRTTIRFLQAFPECTQTDTIQMLGVWEYPRAKGRPKDTRSKNTSREIR